MKRLIKAMATTAVTLMAMQANAIQVTYTFRVNSSGPSMYPCNAGLSTDNPYEGDKAVCYTADTHEACTQECVGLDCQGGQKPEPHPTPSALFSSPPPTFNQGQCQKAGGNWTHISPGDRPDGDQDGHAPWGFCKCSDGSVPTNDKSCSGGGGGGGHDDPKKNACVCTTEQGRKNGNYFHATYVPWGEGQDPHSDIISGVSPNYNQLFSETNAYKWVLQKLAFNLGSELYTAKYFVDICYRGSQIDYGTLDTKFNLLAEASVTDYGFKAQGKGYSELADLEMKAYIICTTQNKTCEHGDCSEKDTYLNGTEVARFKEPFQDALGKGNYDYSKESNYTSATSSSFVKLIDEVNKDLNNGAATKFCKVRYVFSETNGLDKSTAKHRKWQKHGADICTHTKIEMSDMGKCTHCHD